MKIFSVISKTRPTWLIPLIAGFVTIVLGFIIYNYFNPNYPKYVFREAKAMQLSPHEYKDLENYSTQLNPSKMSKQDWDRIQALAESNNNARKIFGLSIMTRLYKSPYRQDAVRYAEKLIDNHDPVVKTYCLLIFAKMRDTRWKSLAQKHSQYPDSHVRETALSLLAKEDRFK